MERGVQNAGFDIPFIAVREEIPFGYPFMPKDRQKGGNTFRVSLYAEKRAKRRKCGKIVFCIAGL